VPLGLTSCCRCQGRDKEFAEPPGPVDPEKLAALRYVTTTAVPLAVTISIEPFWPTVS
jgi:hypothetical protein